MRETKRIGEFDRAIRQRARIGLWASIAWLLVAGYYANPGSTSIWDHPFLLAAAALIAFNGEQVGAVLVTTLMALFTAARGFVLLSDRQFVPGSLAVALSLAAIFIVYLASGTPGHIRLRRRNDASYAAPDQEMIDRFGEIEARMRSGKPFGIFLRSFYKETPLPAEATSDGGTATGSKADYRVFHAIRDLIGSDGTYSILNPIDPVHANPFPTAIADPDNWRGELNRLLARASWIVLFYEYETEGLHNEVRLLGEKYADKSIAVFEPRVHTTDPVWTLLSTTCKWSFRLQPQGVNQANLSNTPAAMAVDAPAAFHEWLEQRKAGLSSVAPSRSRL
jgi:hypothetical protein